MIYSLLSEKKMRDFLKLTLSSPYLKTRKKTYIPGFQKQTTKGLHSNHKQVEGERPPCLNPLKLRNKPMREPLTKTETLAIEMHHLIQSSHFCLNPILARIANKKPQLKNKPSQC